jgi:Tfp pilus assembly protein PilF
MQGKNAEENKSRERVKEIDESRNGLVRVVALISKSPNDVDLRRQAALLCLHCDRNVEALQWLQGSLQINPTHKPTHAALADYYEQMGQPDLAAPHREAAAMPGTENR